MDEHNQFYGELCKCLNSDSVVGILEWMAAHGQSVLLNYGEDDQHWECSWITSGERFTGMRIRIEDAVKDSLGKVRNEYLENFDFSTGVWRSEIPGGG